MSNDETTPETTPAESGLIARLKKHKAEHSGVESTVLPETGVTATWPQFKDHGLWMKAARLAKGNAQQATPIYLALLCKFDGERLTIAEFQELIPTDDVMHLIGEVMGDAVLDDNGETEGNALH